MRQMFHEILSTNGVRFFALTKPEKTSNWFKYSRICWIQSNANWNYTLVLQYLCPLFNINTSTMIMKMIEYVLNNFFSVLQQFPMTQPTIWIINLAIFAFYLHSTGSGLMNLNHLIVTFTFGCHLLNSVSKSKIERKKTHLKKNKNVCLPKQLSSEYVLWFWHVKGPYCECVTLRKPCTLVFRSGALTVSIWYDIGDIRRYNIADTLYRNTVSYRKGNRWHKSMYTIPAWCVMCAKHAFILCVYTNVYACVNNINTNFCHIFL